MADDASPRPARGQLAIIGIFALGVVFGAALCFAIVHHLILPERMGMRHEGPVAVERMKQDLGLDSEQEAKVKAILERGHASMRGILDETGKEIRAVLRPDQQERFDRMRPRSPFGHAEHGGEPPR